MFTVDIISMVALFRHQFTDTLQVVLPGAKDKRIVLPLVKYFINTRECSGFHVFAPHHQEGGVSPVPASTSLPVNTFGGLGDTRSVLPAQNNNVDLCFHMQKLTKGNIY